MFKKITSILTVLAISAGALLANATNVAVVDMNLVLQSFSKTPIVEKALKADFDLAAQNEKDSVAELRKKQDQLKKLIEEINSPLNSENAKEKAKKEATELDQRIKKEYQELIEATNQIKRALEEKKIKMINELLGEITPVITEYAKENKIDLILNTANGVIFAGEKTNITPKIIEILNKKFPPAPTAEEKK